MQHVIDIPDEHHAEIVKALRLWYQTADPGYLDDIPDEKVVAAAIHRHVVLAFRNDVVADEYAKVEERAEERAVIFEAAVEAGTPDKPVVIVKTADVEAVKG